MGYINLSAAIIKQAMKDYKKALRKNNKGEIKALERFFLSRWGQLLSANSGEYIIELCRKECQNGGS